MEPTRQASAEDEVQTRFRMAVGAANAGDHERARRLFAEVTERRPELTTAWLWRAHLEESAYTKLDFLRRAHELDPDDARTARTLHRTLLQAGVDCAKHGRHDVARELLAEITELQPTNEVAWLWRVSVAADMAEKGRFLERVLAINPQNTQALAWRAQLAEEPAETPADRGCVLVIDDSITVRVLIRRTLEDRGWRVAMAASAREGLELITRETPRLIFLDVDLPDMNGYTLCKRLRGDPAIRVVPVVMLTTGNGVGERFRRRLAGAAGVVAKPFETDDLVRFIERFLGPEPG